MKKSNLVIMLGLLILYSNCISAESAQFKNAADAYKALDSLKTTQPLNNRAKYSNIKWSMLYNDTMAKSADLLPINGKRITDICYTDTLSLKVYRNGIMREEGTAREITVFFGKVFKTINNITAGMSKEQVVKILGAPKAESSREMQFYAGPEAISYISFFFDATGLYAIKNIEATDECVE